MSEQASFADALEAIRIYKKQHQWVLHVETLISAAQQAEQRKYDAVREHDKLVAENKALASQRDSLAQSVKDLQAKERAAEVRAAESAKKADGLEEEYQEHQEVLEAAHLKRKFELDEEFAKAVDEHKKNLAKEKEKLEADIDTIRAEHERVKAAFDEFKSKWGK